MRMNQSRLPRKLLRRNLGTRERLGKPTTRWQDEVKKNMREIGITDWRKSRIKRPG